MLVLALFVFSALCIQSVRSDTIIDRVHVVFSCHLDVGYAALIADIVNEWFDLYFPQAIATANAMRAGGGEDRFKFMTHSWLVSMYLDCPVGLGFHCPNASAVNDFVAAVKRGDIYWHAYGFNSEPEGYPDSSLFEFGVQLTHALDEKFSLKRKTTLSQRDVPGMTRGVIPILAKHGVNAISIGVNGGCAPPAVPKIFKWKDNATQAWVYGLVHAGGYGGISVSDCATAPGFRSALAYAWRTDNSGPQSVSEVESIYEQIRKEFPGAQVFASSFDTFVDELAAADALGTVDLEVVTKEMGDTWIYGYASDPKKMASLRAFSAMRDKCLHEGWCVLDDPRIFNSSRFLLKLSEHTWGYYAITGDGNPPYWSNEEFELHRNASGFQVAAQSYVEQAQYVDWALQALGNHPLAAVVETELLNLVPTRPLLGGLQSIPAEKFGRDLQCGSSITLALDSNTGAIVKLIANGVSLATSSNRIAQLAYSTYDERDFDWYLKEYAYNGKVEQSAFTKPELETAHPSPVSKTWFPILLDLWWSNSTSVGCRMVQKLQFGHFPSSVYGAPKEVWMEVDMDSYSGQDFNVIVSAFNKTATRMPEALWLSFNPVVSGNGSWWMNKLGTMVSPLEVMVNGSQAQHAIARTASVFYAGNASEIHDADFFISSLDALVVSPTQSPFPAIEPLSAVRNGLSFLLLNNCWNTNFPLFYPYTNNANDSSLLFRWELTTNAGDGAMSEKGEKKNKQAAS